MGYGEAPRTEWVDGFLFVGNHPSLDLLNTRLVNAEGPVELLPDSAALERWVHACGMLENVEPAADPPRIARLWSSARANRGFLRQLLAFRESLRAAVLRFEAGKIPDAFLAELNAKLLRYPLCTTLKRAGKSIEPKVFLDLESPSELWAVVASQAADLFLDVPASRVRQCGGCVVHFYDRSKKGSRRWCSMQMCGNRDKVTTYRQRQREAQP